FSCHLLRLFQALQAHDALVRPICTLFRHGIKSIILKREDILNEKENQIKVLQDKLEKQRKMLKTRLMELEIQRQQEEYMARVLQKS
ncbi:hypothetical protein JZ751_007079, partial [Albula glossodonta]